MNFKKKVNGSWVDAPYYLKSTDTDTITTLPAIIYPLAQTATLGLKGNTVQNGTPTPQNPVPVVGVGDDDNGQYKIPISLGGVTTTEYLGQVQSTRKIEKLVLDGRESWSEGTFNYYIFIDVSGRGEGVPNSAALSTHTENGVEVNNNGTALFFKKSVFVHSSLTDFKTYLQQQYAAGTPVTVYYVLATTTTGIVNEPLMKIGDYADSISGISIPTTAGANALDVQTTLKPSEVTATFNGWHPVTSAHECENGAWT